MIIATSRVIWIDIFKGIGILLVVIGHILAEQKVYTPLYNIIYMFHMPLFFFISGYLYKQNNNIGTHIKDKAIQLLIPYFFILLLFIPVNGLGAFINDGLNTKSMINYLMHLLSGGRNFGGATGAFWFITCLFCVQIIYNIISVKCKSSIVNIIIILMLILSYINSEIYPQYWLPGDANVALFALSIYHLGYLYRKYEEKINIHPLILTVLSLLVIVSVILEPSNRMDMKNSMYGIPVLSLLSSLIMILFTKLISQKIASIAVLSTILLETGKASLAIMYFHLLFIAIFNKFITDNMYLVTPLVVIISYGIYYLANRSRISRVLILGSKTDYYSIIKKTT